MSCRISHSGSLPLPCTTHSTHTIHNYTTVQMGSLPGGSLIVLLGAGGGCQPHCISLLWLHFQIWSFNPVPAVPLSLLDKVNKRSISRANWIKTPSRPLPHSTIKLRDGKKFKDQRRKFNSLWDTIHVLAALGDFCSPSFKGIYTLYCS